MFRRDQRQDGVGSDELDEIPIFGGQGQGVSNTEMAARAAQARSVGPGPAPVPGQAQPAPGCPPNQYLINEVHDNSLLIFEGMKTGLQSVVTALQEPSGGSPSIWASLIDMAVKSAIHSAKPLLGVLVYPIAGPVASAVGQAFDTVVLGKDEGARSSAPLALFQEVMSKKIMALRGQFTSFYWGSAASVLETWDPALLQGIARQLWDPRFIDQVVAHWKREVVVAWSNYLAQHHHGSTDGAVDYRTVDDQNIAERSHYFDHGDPRSKGILNVDIHYQRSRDAGVDGSDTQLHRLYVNGIPEALKDSLRSFGRVRDAHMNTIIRVLTWYADSTHAQPVAVLVVGPDGQLIRSDTTINVGYDDEEMISAGMDMPMKFLK